MMTQETFWLRTRGHIFMVCNIVIMVVCCEACERSASLSHDHEIVGLPCSLSHSFGGV